MVDVAGDRGRQLADAKGAHDTVTAAALRAQADANEIIAQAQRRLADEYDAAQGFDGTRRYNRSRRER